MSRTEPIERQKFGIIALAYIWLSKKIADLIIAGLHEHDDVFYSRRLRLTNFVCLNSAFLMLCFGVVLCCACVFIAASICFLFAAGSLLSYSLSAKRKSLGAYYLMNINNLLCSVLLFLFYGHYSGAYFVIILWLISVVFLSNKPKEYIPMFLLGVLSYFGVELFFVHFLPLMPAFKYDHCVYFAVLVACFAYLISFFEFFKKTNRVYQVSLEEKNKQLLKYYKAMEQTYATIVITDTDGNIEYANPQFEVTTGYSIEEALGKNPRILKSNKTPAKEYKELWNTITKGKVWHGEFINLNKNHEEYTERATISPIINAKGDIINYVAIKEDITELNKAEQALKESQRKYKLLAENSADVIWSLDILSQRLTYVSPSIFQLRGITVEEAMVECLSDFFVADSYQKAIDEIEKTLIAHKTGTVKLKDIGNYQQYHKDGSIVDVEINSNLVLDEQGNPKELVGVSRDITKRKLAEQALIESEAKFKLIAENTYDVIWKIDLATFKYNYISPSVYSMRGFTVDEAINQTVEESLTPEYYQRAIKMLNEYLQRSETYNLNIREQFKQPCKDGSIIDVELSASFIRNEKGEPIEILGVTRDISERIKNDLALKRSEAKLAKLLERQTLKNQRLSSQLEYIYNNTVNAVAFFDIVGESILFSSCNKLWANSIGYEPNELDGFDIALFSDKEIEKLYRETINKAIELKTSIQDYAFWHNMYLHVIIIPIIDEQNGLISSCAAFVYNITENYEAKLKLKETEEKFQTIFNNSTDAIVVFTPDLNFLEVNDYYYQLTGFTVAKGKMMIDEFAHYIPIKYHNQIFGGVSKLVDGQKVPTFECEMFRADGSLIPVELNSSLFNYNGVPAILCMIRDVSVRKSMESKLTRISIQTETRERRKLATDLHDNVGPLLSSMNMYLSALFINPEIKKHSEAFNDVRRILKESISAVREISNNISPHVLVNYGVSAALHSFFETKNKLIEINITDQLTDLRFSETKEIMVYNIIKEAFNNTLKYAHASIITIKLVLQENIIHISYADDGVGFVLAEKLDAANSSLGLFSMINRIKILDGTYQIKTAPSQGFVLDIWFPIENV